MPDQIPVVAPPGQETPAPVPAIQSITVTPAHAAAVADATGSTDENFDPASLDDAALNQFLGIEPAKPAEKTAQEQLDEAGDKAAAGALENALDDKAATPSPDAATAASTPSTDGASAEPPKKSYTVYGDDGVAIEKAPIKEIELKVAGKQKRVDFDGLVRMAQSGGYNEQLQQEVAAARDQLPTLQTRAEQMERMARQLYDEREAILADPNFYLKKVEEFAQARTPEAENSRLKQENDALRATTMQQHATQEVARAAESVILPRFTALAQKYPNVKTEELIGQLDTLIRPYRAHGGAIDPRLLPHVLDIIDRVIEPTAQQLHDAREEVAKAKTLTSTAEAKAAKTAADAQAQVATKVNKAKNDLSRTIAPVGRVTNRPAPPKQRPKTANEGADRALEDALESVLGSSAA